MPYLWLALDEETDPYGSPEIFSPNIVVVSLNPKSKPETLNILLCPESSSVLRYTALDVGRYCVRAGHPKCAKQMVKQPTGA